MEVSVLNTNFERIDIVDAFESLIWTDRYYSCGDFELYLPINDASLKSLQIEYYLQNRDSEHGMIIEKIFTESDVDAGNHLTVIGRSFESILERRIVWGQKIISGNLQNAIKTLLYENIISPAIADRRIDNFIFEESSDPEITSIRINETQYTGDNLLEVISGLCESNDIGFKVVLNDANQFVFSLYAGEDRSYNQTDNQYVIFSPKFENVINSSYFSSVEPYKNVTLVAGEGEGASRRTSVVGSGRGLNRRELFTDARDISSDTDGGTLTDAQYIAQLNQRGIEKLAECKKDIAFEGESETTQMFQYGRDFFIGDLVQSEDEYGHSGVSRIIEFIMSQDGSGLSKYPTFKFMDEEG